MTTALSLKGFAKAFYILGVAFLVSAMVLSFAVIPVGAAPISGDLQLNLSHIACVNGQVEIHFVLLNVPDGVVPGTLTYTYGTLSPTGHTGNVWSYLDYKPSGYYDISSASVDVNGTTVTLHNPDAYAGTYNCAPTSTATSTFVPTATFTPTTTFTPTSMPSSTATATAISTQGPSETPTATFTATATSLPTETLIPTATGVTFTNLSFRFVCSLTGTSWRVTNPNSFDVTFSFSLNGAAFQDFTAPAGANDLIFTNSDPVAGSMNLSYMLNGVLQESKLNKTTACEVATTSTPSSASTAVLSAKSTPVPTLIAPSRNSASAVLIPVTGTDLISYSQRGFSTAQKALIDFGFGFLGMGFILQGFSRKPKK